MSMRGLGAPTGFAAQGPRLQNWRSTQGARSAARGLGENVYGHLGKDKSWGSKVLISAGPLLEGAEVGKKKKKWGGVGGVRRVF